MSSAPILKEWIVEYLEKKGKGAPIVEICKHVWNNHEEELRNMGDLFYTWQYDIRWAATELRKEGKLKDESISPRGIWELIDL